MAPVIIGRPLSHRLFGVCDRCGQDVLTHYVKDGPWLTGWYVPPVITEEPW